MQKKWMKISSLGLLFLGYISFICAGEQTFNLYFINLHSEAINASVNQGDISIGIVPANGGTLEYELIIEQPNTVTLDFLTQEGQSLSQFLTISSTQYPQDDSYTITFSWNSGGWVQVDMVEGVPSQGFASLQEAADDLEAIIRAYLVTYRSDIYTPDQIEAFVPVLAEQYKKVLEQNTTVQLQDFVTQVLSSGFENSAQSNRSGSSDLFSSTGLLLFSYAFIQSIWGLQGGQEAMQVIQAVRNESLNQNPENSAFSITHFLENLNADTEVWKEYVASIGNNFEKAMQLKDSNFVLNDLVQEVVASYQSSSSLANFLVDEADAIALFCIKIQESLYEKKESLDFVMAFVATVSVLYEKVTFFIQDFIQSFFSFFGHTAAKCSVSQKDVEHYLCLDLLFEKLQEDLTNNGSTQVADILRVVRAEVSNALHVYLVSKQKLSEAQAHPLHNIHLLKLYLPLAEDMDIDFENELDQASVQNFLDLLFDQIDIFSKQR